MAAAVTDFGPSIVAARKAQAKHIELLVVGLSDDLGMLHLQEMANIGAGLPQNASPGAKVHFPEDPAALTDGLRALIEGEITCDFALTGARIKAGSECTGNVTLNGAQLGCNEENGWSLLDPTQLRLHGSACDTLKASTAVLAASFPCDAVE